MPIWNQFANEETLNTCVLSTMAHIDIGLFGISQFPDREDQDRERGALKGESREKRRAQAQKK